MKNISHSYRKYTEKTKRVAIIIFLIITAIACQNKQKIKPKATTTERHKDSLFGIDISHHQMDIDWDKVKQSGISFVFIKATEGNTYSDPMFKKHWSDAKQKGILRGAYHFYHYTDAPDTQASFFINTVKNVWTSEDLLPVLDLETYTPNSGVSVEQYSKDVKRWLNLVEDHFKKRPMIYTDKLRADTYLQDTAFASYPLWIAEYEVTKPDLPIIWEKPGYALWQYSETGKINGIQGFVDLDVFHGNLKDLKTLGN